SITPQTSLESRQYLLFSTMGYDVFIFSNVQNLSVSQIRSSDLIILAGIAKPEPLFNQLKNENDLLLKYPDHHNFSDKEIEEIKNKANGKIIVTTEKDYVRIKDKFDSNQLYYLPIKTEFL